MYCYEKYYCVFYRMQEIGNNANVDVETLLMQLENAEKRNQELLNKNKNLLEEKEFLEEKIKVYVYKLHSCKQKLKKWQRIGIKRRKQ